MVLRHRGLSVPRKEGFEQIKTRTFDKWIEQGKIIELGNFLIYIKQTGKPPEGSSRQHKRFYLLEVIIKSMRTSICGHVNPLMITSPMTFQFVTRYKLNATKPANRRWVNEPRQVLNSGVTDQTRSVFTARNLTIMNLWSVWFRKSWATISGGRSVNSPRV